MTLAIHPLGGVGDWHAGVNYLCGLLQALRESASPPRLLALVPGEQASPELTDLVDEVVHGWPLYPPPGSALRAARGLLRRIVGTDVIGDRMLRKRGVGLVAFGDVLNYGRQVLSTGLPYIAWLPDFQHIHHPELFSESERTARDWWYRRAGEKAARVLLMSDAVRRDFAVFAPDLAPKARVLRPLSYIPEALFNSDPTSAVQRYSLPPRFFLLPSYLWRHKDHLTVARAARLAINEHPDLTVVCTGGLVDYRSPTYVNELMANIATLGIRDHFILLGSLPRMDVLSLMRQAIGVVTASLFEGFGLALEEARSLGKPAVASDIPAHREQDLGDSCLFFEPRNVEDLALKLALLWKGTPPGTSPEREGDARRATTTRRRRYAEAFLSIGEEILSE